MTTGEEDIQVAGESLRKKVFHNTAVLVTGRALSIFAGAAASVLLARYLGSEQLGEFGALYAYLSLFVWLASFGIEPVLAREASRRRDGAGSILATGVALCSGFCFAASALAILLASHAGFSGKMRLLVILGAVDILALGPMRLTGVIFQVDFKQWYGAGITFVRQIFWIGAVAVLAYWKAPLTAFVVGRLIGAVLEAILVIAASAQLVKTPWRVMTSQLGPYLRASAPIAISSMLASVYLRVDQVILHNLAPDRVLGNYVAAVKVSELFELLPAALLASVFPVLSAAADDAPKMEKYTDHMFRYMMVTAGALSVCMCVGARLIVRILYGQEYASSGPLLAMLIWSEFAIFFGSVVSNVLLARSLQRFLVYPTAVGAGVNILLNVVLIPRYAATGAAVATIVSYSVAWMVLLLGFQKTRGVIWKGLRRAVPAILMSLGATAAGFLIPLPATFQVLLALGLYIAGIISFRVVHRDDVERLRSILGRKSLDAV